MPRAGHGVMLITIALLTFGVIMVNSAGLTVGAGQATELRDVLWGRHTILAALAVTMMLVASRLPLRRLFEARGLWSPVPWLVAVMVLALLLVHVPGLGREINGARRWINIAGVSFQPSELAKWGILFVLAWYAARNAAVMNRLLPGLLLPVTLVGIICALIVTEDLGTAVLIGFAATGLLVAAGTRLLHATLVGPPAAAAFLLAVVSSPYRLDRLRAFLDPYQDPQGIGYHVIQSMLTVSGGGLTGRGLGNSIQKFGYLPQDTTDFVFAVVCEELGLIGAAAIIGLFGVLLICGLAIIRRAEHPFCRLLGLGIVLTIGLQALVNIAVVTGMAPTKGIALPLVSAGGTGWVLTAFSLGLLISMERTGTGVVRRLGA